MTVKVKTADWIVIGNIVKKEVMSQVGSYPMWSIYMPRIETSEDIRPGKGVEN